MRGGRAFVIVAPRCGIATRRAAYGRYVIVSIVPMPLAKFARVFNAVAGVRRYALNEHWRAWGTSAVSSTASPIFSDRRSWRECGMPAGIAPV